MKVSVQKSRRFTETLNRMERLQRMGDVVGPAVTKMYALSMVKQFKDGIMQNSMNLEKLKDGTIERKRQMGFREPETPLYGRGDERKKDSYMNMLRLRIVRNGHQVFQSTMNHWSSGKKIKGKKPAQAISLDHLFQVHEYRKTIMRGKTAIRIPPRPAFRIAYDRVVKAIKGTNIQGKVKTAIVDYINGGGMMRFKKKIADMSEGLKAYEVHD